MLGAITIARKDLRQRLRDRSAIIVGIVAPVAIAGLMALAFRGVETFGYTLGVVDLDHGPVAAGLLRALEAPQLRDIVTVRPMASAGAVRAALRIGGVEAALVIPAGFSASVTSSHPAGLTTLASSSDTIAGDVTSSIASSFVAQVNADRLAFATALAAGAPAADAVRLATEASRLHLPLGAVVRPVGARELRVISYYSPGMAIFFLLFMVAYTARSYFVDRSQGMIERIRAAPVRPFELLLGKALSVFVYGTVSLATIAVVTSAAFGADWGPPLPAVLLGLGVVVSVVCLTAFVIAVSRTQRQAEAIGSVVIFGLALLGGNFFFLSTSPSLLRRLALLTPNGWALRGFTDLATVGGGVGVVVEPLAGIAVFSVVVGGIAVALARRAVRA